MAIIIILALLCVIFFGMWFFGRPESMTDYKLHRLLIERKSFNWVEFGDLSEGQLKWKTKQYNVPPEVIEKTAFIIGTTDSELAWFFDIEQKIIGMGFATYGLEGIGQFIPAGNGSLLDFEPDNPHQD